jgi:hypothetical protein
MSQYKLPELSIIARDSLSFCDQLIHILDTKKFSYITDLKSLQKLFFHGKSWRLTRVGRDILITKFKSYISKNECNRSMTGKIILNMDSCCNSPWYNYDDKVIFFDETLHFELQMVSGDLNGFVNFKSTR